MYFTITSKSEKVQSMNYSFMIETYLVTINYKSLWFQPVHLKSESNWNLHTTYHLKNKMNVRAQHLQEDQTLLTWCKKSEETCLYSMFKKKDLVPAPFSRRRTLSAINKILRFSLDWIWKYLRPITIVLQHYPNIDSLQKYNSGSASQLLPQSSFFKNTNKLCFKTIRYIRKRTSGALPRNWLCIADRPTWQLKLEKTSLTIKMENAEA